MVHHKPKRDERDTVAAQIAAAGYDAYLETIFKRLNAQILSYNFLMTNGHQRPENFQYLKDFIKESKLFELEQPDLLIYKKAPAGASVRKKGGAELKEQLKDTALLIEATNARQKATVSFTVKMVSGSVGSAQQEQRSAAPSPAPGAQQTEPPQPDIAEALPRQPQAAPQPSAAAPAPRPAPIVPPAEPPLTDLQSLDGLLRCQAFLKDCTTAKVVTVDAETAEGEMGPELSLIQIAAGENVYVFDVLELAKLGQVARLFDLLEVVLHNHSFVKVVHDLAPVAHMLKKALGLVVVEPVYDTQLLCEVRAGAMWGGVVDAIDILREAARKTDPSYAAMAADTEHKCKQMVDGFVRFGRPVWRNRPLSALALKCAVDDVRILNKFVSMLAHNPAEYQHILESSGRRLQWVLDHPDTYWRRPVAFVPAGAGFRMASAELHPDINAPQRSSETAMADAAEGVPSMADTPAMDNAKSAEVQEGEKDMFWGAGDGKNNSADGEAPAEQTKQQCSDWANADEQDDAKQNMWGASDAQGDEHEEGDMLNMRDGNIRDRGAMARQFQREYMQIVRLLPEVYRSKLLDPFVQAHLRDISLDEKRRPQATLVVGRKKQLMYLNDDANHVLTADELEYIVGQLTFGHDNRAGMDGSLHRISCIRNRSDRITGVTMRIGRCVPGNADIIKDLVHGEEEQVKSILCLGKAGSGKTTIIRECARVMSQYNTLFVVDTSNEICGDGDLVHWSVGKARRMMVKTRDVQASVMIECLQNHTPDVIIVDEIGRSQEAQAARDVGNRGVTIIGSAHGEGLRDLLKNQKLNGLLGGTEQVILGDAAARDNDKRKMKSERCGKPVFDVVIVLDSNDRNAWTVIDDVAQAVDDVLAGRQYQAKIRRRNPETGEVTVELALG